MNLYTKVFAVLHSLACSFAFGRWMDSTNAGFFLIFLLIVLLHIADNILVVLKREKEESWECPKCGRVYSPIIPACFYCGNQKLEPVKKKKEIP